MSIITFQSQECKVSNPISMTKARLSKDLFTNIFENTLTSGAYTNLVNTLKNSLRGGSSETEYARVKDVILDTFNGKYNPKYSTYMSQLSKLGMICTYRGHIHLNPLVKTKVTSKLHETALEYYRLMWSDPFLSTVYIKYEGGSINLSSETDLKQLIANDKKEFLQCDLELSHLTTQEIYDIAFTHTKNTLRGEGYLATLNLDNSNSLIRLKASMGNTYKNLGFQVTQQLAAAHLDLLIEQLPLVDNGDTHYIFGRLPKKFKCIDFTETSTYREATELYKQHNQPTDKIIMTSTLYPNLNPEERPHVTSTRTIRPLNSKGNEVAITEQEISEALCGRGCYLLPSVRKLFCDLNPKTAQQLKDEGQLDPEALAELEHDLKTYGHKGKEQLQLFPYHYCTEERKALIAKQDAINYAKATEYNNQLRACNERNHLKHRQLFKDYLEAKDQWGFTSLKEYKEAIGYQPEKVSITY